MEEVAGGTQTTATSSSTSTSGWEEEDPWPDRWWTKPTWMPDSATKRDRELLVNDLRSRPHRREGAKTGATTEGDYKRLLEDAERREREKEEELARERERCRILESQISGAAQREESNIDDCAVEVDSILQSWGLHEEQGELFLTSNDLALAQRLAETDEDLPLQKFGDKESSSSEKPPSPAAETKASSKVTLLLSSSLASLQHSLQHIEKDIQTAKRGQTFKSYPPKHLKYKQQGVRNLLASSESAKALLAATAKKSDEVENVLDFASDPKMDREGDFSGYHASPPRRHEPAFQQVRSAIKPAGPMGECVMQLKSFVQLDEALGRIHSAHQSLKASLTSLYS